jgi:hypothetical protein
MTEYKNPHGEFTVINNRAMLLRDVRAARHKEENNPSLLNSKAARSPSASYQRRVEAYRAFGALNGWQTMPDYYFQPEYLGRSGRGAYSQPRWADHAVYYKAPRRDGKRGLMNVAIVGQPYGFNSFIAEELAELVGRGLKVTVPPHPFASIWYPRATIFLVVTLPETKVWWLPEQEIAVPELKPDTATAEYFHENFQVFAELVGLKTGHALSASALAKNASEERRRHCDTLG